ncbi:Chromosome segregation in meiosis protein [Lachnellula suecica]|uniref:Chromosome segregation in meiosis protein n=1 Tax=Lachnellula suecica TaxID=602035 RepID=A0A8T9BUS5_9HELO|nr:Chromosome segregation in meiosis protein [Lachnellula suecica]
MSSPTGVTSRYPPDGPSAGGDELDDLFDYDGGIDDPFSDNYVVPSKPNATNASAETGGKSAGLGIDEEVEVTRKPRAPRVKLDEHRLLSAAGIPKLRKKARDHLKFKGKGHEYADASRLLAFYQLWLDDLFPKARFLDALAMVEKMGHKKMMQSARMAWIDEGKPHSSSGVHEDSLFDEPSLPVREKTSERAPSKVAPVFEQARQKEKTPENRDVPEDEDLYDATPRPKAAGASIFGPAKGTSGGDNDMMEDDLDALLAQEDSMVPAAITSKPAAGQQDDFDDDLDALMAEEEGMLAEKPKAAVSKAADFDDEMEAMAEMDGLWE